MIQFPNRVGVLASFVSGTPDSVDLSGETPLTGLIGFADAATGESWSDGDTLGVLVLYNAANWIVATGTWDSISSSVELTSVELSEGSITDGTAVNVIAIPTRATLLDLLLAPQAAVIENVAATTYTLSASDAGKLIRFTSATAVTVTTDPTLPVDFHCQLVQSGAGLVSVAVDGVSADTLNNASANVSMSGRYTTAYLVQPVEGEWEFYA